MKEILMKELQRLQKMNDELEAGNRPDKAAVARENGLAMCEVSRLIRLLNSSTSQTTVNITSETNINAIKKAVLNSLDQNIEDRNLTIKQLKTKVNQLNKQFFIKDTPENRMKLLHEASTLNAEISRKESEIANKFAMELQNQELSYEEAISLLGKIKEVIWASRFNIVHQD